MNTGDLGQTVERRSPTATPVARPTVERRSPTATPVARPTVEGRSPTATPVARPTVERRSPMATPVARPTVERRSPAKALRRRIGIDVGGTNTDAVLLDGERVVAAVKTPTTADVTGGVTRALAELLATEPSRISDRPPTERAGLADPATTISAVMIGTTHFTNAVVQRRGLTRVAAVRIGLPASASLPPFVDWPDDLAELVRGEVVMLQGGHEYDGRPIVP